VIDGLSTAPLAARPDTFRPNPDAPPGSTEAADRENSVGPRAVAAPGNLLAWCEALARFGTMPLPDVVEPAIRHAARGFAVTPYLSECIAEVAADLARDGAIAARFLPGGTPLRSGARLVQADYAETLRAIARDGAAALYGGAVGQAVTDHMARVGGLLSPHDLAEYRTVERAPVRGTYRGATIVGPPPPSSGGVHVIPMLNILEGHNVAALGFGTPDALHLLAEALKIAFADRAAATADPAFVRVPVGRLTDKGYAAERRARIDMARAQDWAAEVVPGDGPNTTHLTVADGEGRIVCATHTINNLFGARFLIPGVGLIPNNYMALFDPRPGRTQSFAPGKRISTSQAPIIALRADGSPRVALGMPGGLRIFGSVMQALVNLIDHGMTLQQAVEAPRLWTQGAARVVEVETGFPEPVREVLAARGHAVQAVPHVGGGMCAIGFEADGMMEGAACWRADGVAIGLGGGLARRGARFWPDAAGR
jgi:gamma-glutamyltranspeptidase / glutathione hydrolase